MERVAIAVEGPADRLLADGLGQLESTLGELGDSALVVGGLMTRIWLQLRPRGDLPMRATADLDLGIDRTTLRLTGERRLVGPMLERLGFEPGMGDEAFRYSKTLPDGSSFLVDLLVAPGASRADPPLLEGDTPTVAAPGLAYAFNRGAVTVRVEFVEHSRGTDIVLRVPELDAAFVLKAALVAVRSKPGKVAADTVDALMLAALCLKDTECIRMLAKHRRRSDVRKALRFLDSIDGPGALAARRVEEYFLGEHGVPGGSRWAAETASRLAEEVSGHQ